MPTENAKIVKSFLKTHVYNLSASGSGGVIVDLPEYEIHPREFLSYAESELENLKSKKSTINCISNLKRAIDCQIDIFLHSLNLLKTYKKRNLGIDKKLGFIEKCGIFSKYSLSRINTIRNKLEHHYVIPKIDDIYVYFDIVNAFITVLEVQLLIGGSASDLNFSIVEYSDDENGTEIEVGYLSSTYDPPNKNHIFRWIKKDAHSQLESKQEFIASEDNLDELAAFIHYHSLLLNINRTFHGEYANLQLDRL